MMIEVIGKALEIEPGKTYVIQSEIHISAEEAIRIRDKFNQETGANAIIFAGGLQIARESSSLPEISESETPLRDGTVKE